MGPQRLQRGLSLVLVEIGGHPIELGSHRFGFRRKEWHRGVGVPRCSVRAWVLASPFVGECVVRKVRHLCVCGVGGGTEGVLEMVEVFQQVVGPQHLQSLGINVSQQFLVVEFVFVSKVIHAASRVPSCGMMITVVAMNNLGVFFLCP